MRKNLILAFAAVLVSSAYVVPAPAMAAPITYVYDQTSSSVPGFHPSGTIVIDGGFSDLPNLTNIGNPGPYDFGNLLSFDISVSSGQSFSLSDFIEQGIPSGFPFWHISPGGISYHSIESDLIIPLPGGTLTLNTDRPGLCTTTGTCSSTGNWVAVPEPITLSLFSVGVAGVVAARRRKRAASAAYRATTRNAALPA